MSNARWPGDSVVKLSVLSRWTWAVRKKPAASRRTLSFMISGPIGCIPTCEHSTDAGEVVPARVDIMIVIEPTQCVTQWRS